jgi:hypothetical protein
MSIFPEQLDTDLEIPRVDNEVSEISGDSINALRDAVFNIQKALGISPQGNKTSLAERIAVSIDSDGNIKSSALESLGLVTLPITNSQVGGSAAIAESKLDLDFSTQSLKNSINSLSIDVSSLQNSLNGVSSSFIGHTSGTSDRHDGYQIDVGAIAGLTATTVGDALNEFSTIFITGDGVRPPHIDLGLPNTVKHIADYISVDASNFTTISSSSTNVQEALDSIDEEVLGQQAGHMDNFHSNGILKEINSGEFYNPNQKKYGPATVSYTAGTTVAKISGVTSFSDLGILKSDILEIQSGVNDEGTFRISATGPRSGTDTLGDLPELDVDEVEVFHVFSTTESSATGSIYKAASISSESAPLACSIRNSETLVDTITILNPDAARVVSIGFNGTILGTDGYEINIEVGVGSGMVRGLTIPNLHLERLGSSPPDVVSSQTVAERINAYVSHPDYGHHFPISAFRVGNELAIAHNMVGPEFTLKVLDGYTGNRPLGLDEYGADILGLDITGNENNLFNVNGISRSSLRTLVDGYASIDSETDTFAVYNDNGSLVNPTNLGIRSGAVIHITGHPTLNVNGSYTLFSTSSTDVSVFSTEKIPAPSVPTIFSVNITDSHVSLNQLFTSGAGEETDLGLVEIFVDEDGRALINQRLTHDNLGPSPEYSVIGLTDGFPVETITINQATVIGTDLRTFNIVASSVPGEVVTIHKDFIGTFKLYHPDNINYLNIRVNKEVVTIGSTTVVVDDTLNLDEALRLGVFHFDSEDSITNMIDTRDFGNIATDQIRDDFIELFSQKPVSDLRSNGVVRGLDVMNIPYYDSLTGMWAVPLSGGTAYINGVRVTVETQKVLLQSFDVNKVVLESHDLVIGINDFGTIRAFTDELGEILGDGYSSSIEFGKILPLYKVSMDSNGLIDEITDVRLFVNNLDEKIDLIIDETNNIVGSFRSLAGALLYAESYPGSEKLTIKIVNEVSTDRALVIPDGVSIIGGAPYGGGKHRIVNTLDLNDHFITLSGNNRLENVEIDSENINQDGYLVSVNGSNVNIEKCYLRFSEDVALGSFTNGSDHGVGFESGARTDVRIVNNKIDNVFAGIVSTIGCDNLVIADNILTNIVGFGIETHGIFVGGSRTLSNVEIKGNSIEVPSIAFSDIMGIKVAANTTFDLVRVDSNVIRHDGGDTMTGGIYIESVGTGEVSDLFITNNTVRGIQLNANSIFGVYVNGVERANVHDNMISEIGTTAGNDTAFIKIGDDVGSSNVHNNMLKDGNVLSGIDVGSSSNVSVVGNIIDNVGDESTGNLSDSTVFIRGNSYGAKISDNILIASSSENSPFGIYWAAAGSQTQISNNLFKASSAGLDSFTHYGIRFLGTDMDIVGNTMVGMTSANDPVGISSSSSAVRAKIIGNTIYGTLTSAINLGTNTDCFVSGNMLPSTDASVIGSSNLIGLNRGLQDVIGVSIANGIARVDATVGWDFDSASKRWDHVADNPIYFPLDGIPNGSKLASIQVNGVRSTGTYTITVYRKLIGTPYTATDIGNGTVSSGTDFTKVVNTSSEVIDHSTYTYMIEVDISGGSSGNDRIHGVFMNIRY